jgi:methionyl aminopeptidase
MMDEWQEDMRQIKIHGAEAFAPMRRAGKLAAEVLDMVGPHIKAGVPTNHLNQLCHDMIVAAGAIPAPLNYHGFPKSICTSVNHVVCHGIPDDKPLKYGDMVNVDVTVIVDGWYGDTSRMFFVGEPPIKGKRLTQVTFDALWKGIECVKPGARFGDIGAAIQQYVEAHGYSVVREYCGHGIGQVFHDAPNVLHYGKAGAGPVMEPGMFFTIEPMVNAGKKETKLDAKDGWTVTTKDRSLSAQFEHTIAVTETGYEVFTLSPKKLFCPPYEFAA